MYIIQGIKVHLYRCSPSIDLYIILCIEGHDVRVLQSVSLTAYNPLLLPPTTPTPPHPHPTTPQPQLQPQPHPTLRPSPNTSPSVLPWQQTYYHSSRSLISLPPFHQLPSSPPTTSSFWGSLWAVLTNLITPRLPAYDG